MPVKINELPKLEIINKYVEYIPEMGVFLSKIKHAYCKIGQVVGLKDRGYIRIYIEKKYYPAHRLAWFIVNGDIPSGHQIDHVDGNRSNNKISNLRIASHADNCRNIKIPKHNRSGVKGVHYNKAAQKWRAQIRCNSKKYWLGDFEKIEEAHAAYCEAAKKLHGDFANIES